MHPQVPGRRVPGKPRLVTVRGMAEFRAATRIDETKHF
jgi:hypothetical protein